MLEYQLEETSNLFARHEIILASFFYLLKNSVLLLTGVLLGLKLALCELVKILLFFLSGNIND